MKTAIRLGVLVAAVAALTGCLPPKIMVDDAYIPTVDKVARTTIKEVGSVGQDENEIDLTNYYVQICDVQDGRASNCNTTLVLENVTNYQFAW